MIVSKNGIEIKPTDKNMPKPSCIMYIDDCTSELCTPTYFSFRQQSGKSHVLHICNIKRQVRYTNWMLRINNNNHCISWQSEVWPKNKILQKQLGVRLWWEIPYCGAFKSKLPHKTERWSGPQTSAMLRTA